MTTDVKQLFASKNDQQELFLTLVDGKCDWKRELAEKGYHSLDVQRRINMAYIFVERSISDEYEIALSPEQAAAANLLTDFVLDIEMRDNAGTVHIENKDGILTVEPSDENLMVNSVSVVATTTYYLGDYDVEGRENSPEVAKILELRAFLQDLDQPVFADVSATNPCSPWLGLFNEAVHKVQALRKSLEVDHIEYSGDAPWMVTEFFKRAQSEKPVWFEAEQAAAGHVSITAAYDEARRFCITAVNNKELSPWRDTHLALYQLFACALKETMDALREPFFKHIRQVYRNHKKVQADSPSVTILLEAYYDFDYLNIYQGVKTGTVRYMEYLEMQVRQKLEAIFRS